MMRGADGMNTVQCAQANSLARKTTGVIVGAGNHSTVQQMSDDRIDLISSYCDRRCDRCAYTERCLAYACHMAIEMCGEAKEASRSQSVRRSRKGREAAAARLACRLRRRRADRGRTSGIHGGRSGARRATRRPADRDHGAPLFLVLVRVAERPVRRASNGGGPPSLSKSWTSSATIPCSSARRSIGRFAVVPDALGNRIAAMVVDSSARDLVRVRVHTTQRRDWIAAGLFTPVSASAEVLRHRRLRGQQSSRPNRMVRRTLRPWKLLCDQGLARHLGRFSQLGHQSGVRPPSPETSGEDQLTAALSAA
jgi:hypothetical protein